MRERPFGGFGAAAGLGGLPAPGAWHQGASPKRRGLLSHRPMAAGPRWRRRCVSPSWFSPKAAISHWAWRGAQSRSPPSQPVMAPGLQPPTQHGSAEGASSTLVAGKDSPVLMFPSCPPCPPSALPGARSGGSKVPTIGARLAMAPRTPPAKTSRQPHPPLVETGKNIARERKEAKIDNGVFLFAFCSLSHGFQFYSPTAKTKTFF